jgi:hypothetical protein
MNQEFQAITDLVEKTAKFMQIQEVDECLDTLYDANQAAKKELREFKLGAREYVKMQQLDSIAEFEW